MNTQIVPQNKLSPTQLMELRSEAANKKAASNVFEAHHKKRAKNTRRGYKRAIKMFAEFLCEAQSIEMSPYLAESNEDIDKAILLVGEAMYKNEKMWSGIKWGMVEEFKKWQLDMGYSLGSINQRLTNIKLHLRLAYKAEAITDQAFGAIQIKTSGVPSSGTREGKQLNESREVTRIGHKKADAIFITDKDADCLKKQPEMAIGARDKLLMCIFIDHGLRVSEVAGLKIQDIDLQKEKMVFWRKKQGGKREAKDLWNVDETKVPARAIGKHHLTADTLAALQAWLPIRATVASDDNDCLLLSSAKGDYLQDRGMSTRALTKRVAYLGTKCGYTREKQVGGKAVTIGSLGAHDMRHHCAECLVNEGYDLPFLIDWFGWSPQTAVKMMDSYRNRGNFAKRDKG